MNSKRQHGFSMIETMIALLILLGVSGIVMTGMIGMMKSQGTISNRTQMHAGVRSATELLSQEIGQAGKISLPTPPAGVNWAMATPVLVPTDAPVTQSVTFNVVNPVTGSPSLFEGEWVTVDTSANRETVQLKCAAGVGNCPFTSQTWNATFSNSHLANVPISVLGAFSTGIIPPAAGVMPNPPAGYAGYPSTATNEGSTGTVLKLYGDVNGDGNMVYVEYTCAPGTAQAPGFLYRNQMNFDAAVKPAVDASKVVLNNVLQNPPDANGAAVPCFSYQVRTRDGANAAANDMVFVTDVEVTLTVQTQTIDPQTNLYQTETKALLNISPRNVFDAYELSQFDYLNRVQLTPVVTKTNLLYP